DFETDKSFTRFHQLGRLARFFDRFDCEFNLDTISLDLLWSGFLLGRNRVYACQYCKEKYQYPSNRFQVSHRATERSDSNDRVICEVENGTAQFRRLLKNEECATVILLDALNSEASAT